MANPSLLILAGDGIGPEVMAEVKKIIGWMGAAPRRPFRRLAKTLSADAPMTPTARP